MVAQIALLVLFLLLSIFFKRILGWDVGRLMALAHTYAPWIASVVSTLLTFLFARWAIRPLSSAHMAHAVTAAGVSAMIHGLLFYGTVAEGNQSLWIFILTIALTVAAGAAAAMHAGRLRFP